MSRSAEQDPTELYLAMHYAADDLNPADEEQYLATRNTDYVLTEQEESYLAGRFDSDVLTEREESHLADRFDCDKLTVREEQDLLATRGRPAVNTVKKL